MTWLTEGTYDRKHSLARPTLEEWADYIWSKLDRKPRRHRELIGDGHTCRRLKALAAIVEHKDQGDSG
jgi:hypothetical protein